AFAQRFYAEGEERTQITMPPGYGYPDKGSDRWAMTYMLMNHRNVTESVYVQYTIRYVTDETLTAVTPIWLDVRNCESDPIFNVPGDKPMFSTYSRQSDFVLPQGGLVVAGGAHLHGGGLRLAATYDDSLPHVRVMGIMLGFLAPQPEAPCAPLPALAPDPDSHPGTPPRVKLPLLLEPVGPWQNVQRRSGSFTRGGVP